MTSHADVKEPEVINESLIRACLTTADYLPISNEKMEEMRREAGFHEIVALSFSFKNILKIDNLLGLDSLVKLALDNNIIEKIEGISHLTRLEWLDLSFNNISVIEGLDALTNLEDLSLSNNRIERLENLDTLVKLNLLSIGNNQLKALEDVLYLRRFRNMKMLSLAGNPLSKDPEYNAYVIAHLSFTDWQSGGHLSYLDYRLVETNSVAAAREQFQDRIMELGDEEKEEAEAKKKQQEREESINEMRRLGLDEMQELMATLFDQDAEKERLSLLPFWGEIVEEIKMEYATLLEPVIQSRKPLVLKKAEERALFERTMAARRSESIGKSMLLIARFSKRVKRLSAAVEREELDGAEALADIARAREELEECRAQLCELQLQQQEVEEQLISAFGARYSEFVGTITSDTAALFERLREKVQAKYSDAVARAMALVDEVSNLAGAPDADADDDGGGGSTPLGGAGRRGGAGGGLFGGEPLTEDQAAFLKDKEAVLNAVSASRDALTAALDAKEGRLVSAEREEYQRLAAGAARESAERDRQRTTEIVAARREYDRTLRALEAYFTG